MQAECARLRAELDAVRRCRYKALCVGVGAYSGGQSVFPNPAKDARDMAGALTGLGYVVDGPVLDCTLPVLNAAVTAFVERIAEGDIVVVFLAGHGQQWNSRNYFLPVECSAAPALNGHTAFELQDMLIGPAPSHPTQTQQHYTPL